MSGVLITNHLAPFPKNILKSFKKGIDTLPNVWYNIYVGWQSL